jgi:hypothetical protein
MHGVATGARVALGVEDGENGGQNATVARGVAHCRAHHGTLPLRLLGRRP